MVYNSIKQNNNNIKGNINRQRALTRQKINTMSTITFLIRCRNSGITPGFLNNLTKNIRPIFDNGSPSDKRINSALNNILDNFHRKLLNLLINMKHMNLKYTKLKIEEQNVIINKKLTIEEQNILWTSEKILSQKYNQVVKQRHRRKFEKLKYEQNNELGIKINEDWFVNKTDKSIPRGSQWLLSLGEKFAIPTGKKEFPLFKMIADVEDCIQTLGDKEVQETARTKFTAMLENHMNKKNLSKRERCILESVHQTKHFLRRNKDILILRADKGNVTVALKKIDYERKMNNIVGDIMTYKKLKKDPTSTLQMRNNSLVDELFSSKSINELDHKRLKSDVATAPRLYGLPKIHKDDCPLRPICSSINSPSDKLSRLMANILKRLTEDSVFNVRDAVQFRDKVNNSRIDKDEKMVSFDVVSLFPSIPVDYAIKLIEEKWEEIKKHTNIPRELFMRILKFCIKDNRYLKYKDKCYMQCKGLPMGSPASPIVADIVMEELLRTSLESVEEKPKLLTKYVDDLFGIIKTSAIDIFLTKLNSFNRNIKFTVEEEANGKLPYLDALVIRDNGRLKIDWYQKPTSSGRLMNFYSSQPKYMIINTANSFIKRVFSISDEMFHEENIKKISEILKKNSFPHYTIKRLIAGCKENIQKQKEREENNEKVYKSVIYVPGFSERILNSNIFDKDKYKIAQSSSNTLRQLFSDTKTKVDIWEKHNVIYKINCLGDSKNKCNRVYVGTTKNKLRTRIAGHKSDFKNRGKLITQKTALAAHCADNNHIPDFEKVKILQRENIYKKRFTLEMLHIINTPREKRMNYKTDTENCAHNYRHIINKN